VVFFGREEQRERVTSQSGCGGVRRACDRSVKDLRSECEDRREGKWVFFLGLLSFYDFEWVVCACGFCNYMVSLALDVLPSFVPIETSM